MYKCPKCKTELKGYRAVKGEYYECLECDFGAYESEVVRMNEHYMKEYNTIQAKEIYGLQHEHEEKGEHYSIEDAANEWVEKFAAKFHEDFEKHMGELEHICNHFCGSIENCKGIKDCPLTNKLLESILDNNYHVEDKE